MQKISLFIMTGKGYSVLQSIVENFSSSVIDCVIAAKDKNIEADFFTEIKELCQLHAIPFYNRTEKFTLNSTFAFAIAWRWLINLETHQKLIVFHDSLLPAYRGFAPLVNSLINGEKTIGVTALFANSEYDRGDIISQKYTDIQYPLKISDAIEINNLNYIALALGIIKTITSGAKVLANQQDDSKATYSLWRDEDDYRISWNYSAETIKRFIDSVGFPYKGAFTFLDDSKVRILDAEIIPDVKIEIRQPGKVIFFENQFPVVVCGEGLLKLTIIVNNESGESLLPLNKFRCRFK